jgi:energy-coupling factor transport system permease protein
MKIPYSFAFALMIAIRFLPTVLKEVNSVVAVQRTRCHRITFNILKPFESVMSYVPIIIPSFIIIFKRAFELFLSAESRGFSPRTYERKKLHVCFGDVLAVSFLLLLVVGSYFV